MNTQELIELSKLAEAFVKPYNPMERTSAENMQLAIAYQDFIAAAHPAKVIELLDTIQALQTDLGSVTSANMRLQAEVDALKADAEWKDIETAPRDCAVLGYQAVGHGLFIKAPMYWSGAEWLMVQFHSDNTEHTMNPTHWVALPATEPTYRTKDGL